MTQTNTVMLINCFSWLTDMKNLALHLSESYPKTFVIIITSVIHVYLNGKVKYLRQKTFKNFLIYLIH
jgi:hypothetical protein